MRCVTARRSRACLESCPSPVRLAPIGHWISRFAEHHNLQGRPRHFPYPDETFLLFFLYSSIILDGGCGGHEIRAWIVIAAGASRFDLQYYRAIPQWVAGYAVMSASRE